MSIMDELGKAIRKKMVNKTAEDIATGLYKSAKGTAVKVAAEVTDEENHEKAREAVRNIGHEARRVGEEALQALGFEVESGGASEEGGESLRERLRREMEEESGEDS